MSRKIPKKYIYHTYSSGRSAKHNKFKTDIQNNFTTGDDRMPDKLQMTLHLLDRYTKNLVVAKPTSDGVDIDQKGDRNKKNMNTSTRRYRNTRSATTAARQGTQNIISETISGRLLIRIRMEKCI